MADTVEVGRSGPVILTEAKKALDGISYILEDDEESEKKQDDDDVAEKKEKKTEKEMEQEFWEAAGEGNEVAMKKILRDNPTLDVNWGNEDDDGQAALHRACINGHDSIVTLLLAHPNINVNQKDNTGCTPFMHACINEDTSCAELLLKDSRVKVNKPDNGGYTPLLYVAEDGHLDIIKVWIASGRKMDLGEPGNEKTDAIGAAKNPEKKSSEDREYFEERKDRCAKVATLLKRFKANPTQTRTEVRKELGIAGRCRLILRSTSFIIIFDPTSLPFCDSTSLDFPVTTPPKLTREQYLAFLDGKPIPTAIPVSSSSPSSSSAPPVPTAPFPPTPAS